MDKRKLIKEFRKYKFNPYNMLGSIWYWVNWENMLNRNRKKHHSIFKKGG